MCCYFRTFFWQGSKKLLLFQDQHAARPLPRRLLGARRREKPPPRRRWAAGPEGQAPPAAPPGRRPAPGDPWRGPSPAKLWGARTSPGPKVRVERVSLPPWQILVLRFKSKKQKTNRSHVSKSWSVSSQHPTRVPRPCREDSSVPQVIFEFGVRALCLVFSIYEDWWRWATADQNLDTGLLLVLVLAAWK